MHARNTFISFLGLGAASATTTVYEYIAEHPQACIGATQSNFFSDVKQFAKGIAWYESLFKTCQPLGVRGELATQYLASPQAAGLIAKTYPRAKLLAVIQNPLISVRAEYVRARQQQKIPSTTSLATFLKQNPEVLLRAKVGRQLVPYFSYYSHADLLVLLEEDVEEDPLPRVAALYDHLGFTVPFVPLVLRHLIVEEEEDVKKRPGLITRGFKSLFKGVRFLVLKIKKLGKRKVVAKESLTSLAKKVPLSAELEAYLYEYYHADVMQLSQLLRRNIDVEWGFRTEASQ